MDFEAHFEALERAIEQQRKSATGARPAKKEKEKGMKDSRKNYVTYPQLKLITKDISHLDQRSIPLILRASFADGGGC